VRWCGSCGSGRSGGLLQELSAAKPWITRSAAPGFLGPLPWGGRHPGRSRADLVTGDHASGPQPTAVLDRLQSLGSLTRFPGHLF